jgi:uncharacterized protein (TIGR02265 family)
VPEKLIFDHTVESLLRTLERPITPEQIKGLDALGIDLSKPLLPAYPLEVYTALIGFIGRQRWPGLPPDEADFEVGRAFIEAYTTQTRAPGLQQNGTSPAPGGPPGRLSSTT